MAASSFADSVCLNWFVDLDQVNSKLQWNPNPRPESSDEPIPWRLIAEHLENKNENPLEFAKRCAEIPAKLLSGIYEGRALLDAEHHRADALK